MNELDAVEPYNISFSISFLMNKKEVGFGTYDGKENQRMNDYVRVSPSRHRYLRAAPTLPPAPHANT